MTALDAIGLGLVFGFAYGGASAITGFVIDEISARRKRTRQRPPERFVSHSPPVGDIPEGSIWVEVKR